MLSLQAVRAKVKHHIERELKLHKVRDKVKDRIEREFNKDDDTRFLRLLLKDPARTGAVVPSSKFLAERMASCIDPARKGPVIELGPGTGPVTEALVRRGIAEDRLVLVEYSDLFCSLLKERFPKATIIQGDAYAIAETLSGHFHEKAAAVVSGLPLLNRPDGARHQLLSEAFGLMQPHAPFVQFTYGMLAPVPVKKQAFSARLVDTIWRNMPPARIWVYRAH